MRADGVFVDAGLAAAPLSVSREDAEALAGACRSGGDALQREVPPRRRKLADRGLVRADFQVRGLWRVTPRGAVLLVDLRTRGWLPRPARARREERRT